MSNQDPNSINSLFQENQQKSQMYSQGGSIPLGSSQANHPPDRQSTFGFSHAFQDTLTFNEIQRIKQLNNHPRAFSFFPLSQNHTISPHTKQECLHVSQKLSIKPFAISFQQQQSNPSTPQNLKSLSHQVYECLLSKGTINYKEIITELMGTFKKYQVNEQKDNNETKNMRRRLYDTINVLHAAGILEKTSHLFRLRKEFAGQKYRGRNSTPHEKEDLEQMSQLQNQLIARQNALLKKKKHHAQVLSKYVIMKKLIERNHQLGKTVEEDAMDIETNRETQKSQHQVKLIKNHQKIQFPAVFMIVTDGTEVQYQTNRSVVRGQFIQLTTDWDALEYLFLTDSTEIEHAKQQIYSHNTLQIEMQSQYSSQPQLGVKQGLLSSMKITQH